MPFLEALPIEMRSMSVISFILFSVVVVALGLFYQKIMSLETVVMKRSTEIERLAEMIGNIEDTLKSLKDDNRQHIDWVREDIKGYTNRVERSLAEIRGQIYKE
jgi:hypothetical protein